MLRKARGFCRRRAWTLGILMFCVVAASAADYAKPRLIPKRFGTVVPDALYRSGRIHESLLPSVLTKHGIDTIVTLTVRDERIPFQDEEQRIAAELGINLVRFPLAGNGTGEPEHYAQALQRIRDDVDAGRQVLVHCAAGTQRTGGAIYLYRTLIQGMSHDEAHREMQQYDFDAQDNPDLLPFLDEVRPGVITALNRR